MIHLGIPRDIKEYLQEVGRGGRDGRDVLTKTRNDLQWPTMAYNDLQ